MNRKIAFCVLAMLCIAALSITSCTAKTVTQTVASTTITQWTASLTETRTVTGQPITLTLPGNVTTIIPPTVTVLDPTTITAPPITTTVINTSVVTLPPVTTTVTNTTTTTIQPTTTVPVLTAADAIDMSVIWLGTMSGTQAVTTLHPNPNTAAEKTYYIALSYKNNSGQQFNSVKFSFALLLNGITFEVATPTNTELSVYTVPVNALSVWLRSATAANVWSFQPFQGRAIGAHDEATILLEVTIDSNTAGNVTLALATVL